MYILRQARKWRQDRMMLLDEKTNLHSWLSQIAQANFQFPAARSLLPTLKTRMVVMAVTMITILIILVER